MEDVKDILKSVFTELTKKQKESDFENVLAAWKKSVDPKTFAHTKIVYLTKEIIHVNVDNSAQLYEINLNKKGILRELKKHLKIEDVRFKLGEIK